MKQVRIIIADDSAAIRKVLEHALSDIDGLDVVGTATNGVEAIQLVKELRPDVLVLDIRMPVKDGVEVIEEIRKSNSETVIVVFTTDRYLREVCLEAGANHFLNKFQSDELIVICKSLLKD